MLDVLALAASLFTAAPAMADDTVAPAATTAAPAAATTAAPAAPVPPAAPPTIFQSLGNQVIAHDTIVSMDSDGSRTVSRAEFDAYQNAQFKLMDANGDGSLSADEVGTTKKKSWIPALW